MGFQGGGTRRRRRAGSKAKSRNVLRRGLKGTKKILKRARKLNRSLLKLISPKRSY